MSISSPWEFVTHRLRALLVGVSIVALLATGCGGGSGGESASGSTDTTTTDGETTTEGDQADAESAGSADSSDTGTGDESYLDAESPLSAYLGFDMSSADMQEQQRLVEQKAQECMRSQGFEYEVSDVGDMSFFDDFEDMGTADYAAEHGYGMVDSYLEFSGGDSEEGAFVDPNEEMLTGMSDTERAAWETALYGPPMDEADFEEGGEIMQEPAGCYGEATADVYGDFAVFEELAPAFEAMDAAFNADPRVVELTTKWATCMQDAGYNFETSDDAVSYISEKMNEIMSQSFAVDAPPPGEGEAGATDAMPEFPSAEELKPQLDELRTEEVALATADAKCQGDDEKKLQEISREYELKFIEENKTTLDKANS